MANNSFIISSKGFYKETLFNKETKSFTILWCKRIVNAKKLTSKQAKAIISKHNINGFVWSPFKEYPTSNKYKLVFVYENEYSFNENDVKFGFWTVEKYIMKDSDFEYLKNKGKDPIKLYSLIEAEKIAYDRNEKILEEIKNKNRKLLQKTMDVFDI